MSCSINMLHIIIPILLHVIHNASAMSADRVSVQPSHFPLEGLAHALSVAFVVVAVALMLVYQSRGWNSADDYQMGTVGVSRRYEQLPAYEESYELENV
jgi:hypothetical protein